MQPSDQFIDWERFRDLLHLLARQALRGSPQGRLDASDLAQDALLRAFRARRSCRAQSEAEFRGWLRRILENQLRDRYRALHRARRDISREKSMMATLEQSSIRLEHLVCDSMSSPSHKVQRSENVTRLATALQQLPEPQREAIELHYLQQNTFAAVAEQMGLSRDQVAGLIRRGIQKLRSQMAAEAS